VHGDRLSTYLSPAAQRLAAGLLLLSPCVPLLFMGEEYGEDRPFPFFCSFGDSRLRKAVRQGRHREFEHLAFQWKGKPPNPNAEATFQAAQLSWRWEEGTPQAGMRRLYQDLLSARRTWPALAAESPTRASPASSPGSADGACVLVLERGGDAELVVWANLTDEPVACPRQVPAGKSLWLSTAAQRYGGSRSSNAGLTRLEAYELVVWGPQGGPS
jgi:maltooligosyltrehalose trehalohydrolase